MMTHSEGLDRETRVMDPEGIRDKQLAAALALRVLIERTDLPVLTWEIREAFTPDASFVELEGIPYRSAVTMSRAQADATELEVMRRWARAFDARITKTRTKHGTVASFEFTYAGVPVRIRTTVQTWTEE